MAGRGERGPARNWMSAPDENGVAQFDVEGFLDNNLDFAGREFDVGPALDDAGLCTAGPGWAHDQALPLFAASGRPSALPSSITRNTGRIPASAAIT